MIIQIDLNSNVNIMTTLKAGQNLLLNNRLWSLWRVHPLEGRALALEAIGASAAAQGMTRVMQAIQYGDELFIEQRRGGYWHANLQRDWVEEGHGPTLKCQAATALDLLNIHTQHPAGGELKNSFSWSYSRSARYNRCPRAYYYHYYAAWEGWQSEAPPPVKQSYLLKNLTNIPQWTGTLVHESIKFAVARLKAGQPVDPESLIQQMRRRAKADFDDSQSGRYRQDPNQLVGFQEHHYRVDLPKSTWQEAWAKAEQCLRTFIKSRLYADLQQLPASSFLDVEALQSFTLAETKVWIQMDLALFDGERITLYDWKTGQIDEQKVRQQLGIYGLYIRYARPEWAQKPLWAIAFDLSQDRLVEFKLDNDMLHAAQVAVEESIVQLQGLLIDSDKNLAELRRFPMIDDLSICHHCQFRELCGR